MDLKLIRNINIQSEILFTYENYAFKRLNPSCKKSAVELLTQEFIVNEPLTLAYLKKFPEEKEKSLQKWRRCWELFADDSDSNEISVCCFDMNNNEELVGAILSRDLTATPEEYEAQIMNDINPVSLSSLIEEKLIENSEEKYKNIFFKKHTVFDFVGGAVKSNHSGKGLIGILILLCQHLAAAKGFIYSFGYATNRKSSIYGTKFNHTKVTELNVKELQFNNIYYFDDLEDSDKYCTLWIKKISPNAITPKL